MFVRLVMLIMLIIIEFLIILENCDKEQQQPAPHCQIYRYNDVKNKQLLYCFIHIGHFFFNLVLCLLTLHWVRGPCRFGLYLLMLQRTLFIQELYQEPEVFLQLKQHIEMTVSPKVNMIDMSHWHPCWHLSLELIIVLHFPMD